MAMISRKTLMSLAISGLLAAPSAWAQDDAPQPGDAADSPAAEVPEDDSLAPVPDHPGVVHVSDCPPGALSGDPIGGSGRRHGPPYAGWTWPGRRVIHRSWVPYHKFFPNSWTGLAAPAPAAPAPIVYMPTDTTQLGYYYQHVPTWHAYTGMVPPVPRPADWHVMMSSSAACRVAPVYSQPTLAPPVDEPEIPTETAPPVPDETALDRSAAAPGLMPIPR